MHEDGCVSVPFVDTVDVDQNIGSFQISCNATANSITFFWQDDALVDQYDIVANGVFTGNQMNTIYEVSGLQPNEMVDLVVTANGNTVCGPEMSSITCQAEDCPPVSLQINPVGVICLDANTSSLQLSYSTSGGMGGGQAQWTGAGISPDGQFDPQLSGAGTITVALFYTEGNCTYQTILDIRVIQSPIANFNIANPVVCEGDPVFISGSSLPGTQYNWNFGGGTILSGTGAGPYEIIYATAGAKTISLEVEENGCKSTVVSDLLQVDPALDIPNINCSTTTSSITFDWIPVSGAVDYQVQLSNGVISNQTNLSYTVSGLNPGDEITLDLSANSGNICPSTTAQLTCTAQDCPPVSIQVDPIPGVCVGNEVLYPLVANAVGSQGGGRWTWTGPGVVNNELDRSQLAPGNYQIVVEYEEQSCLYQSTTAFEIFEHPDLDAQVTSPIFTTYQPIGEVDLTVSGVGPYTYLWNTGDDKEDLNGLFPGHYCVSVTDGNGCKADRCFDVGLGSYRISPVFILCEGGSRRLNVRPSRGAGFQWSPGDDLSCTTCPSPDASPSETTIYELTVTLPTGQTETTKVIVIVLPRSLCNFRKGDLDGVEQQVINQIKDHTISMDQVEQEVLAELNASEDMMIYPNPTGGKITVVAKTSISSIKVFDMAGQLMEQGDYTQAEVEMDLSRMAPGLYQVQVFTENGRTNKLLQVMK